MSYDPRLERLWGLLRESHDSPRLRLPEAAHRVGANKDHLNSLIKDASGLTFGSMVNLYRICRSIELIWVRNDSLTDIYLICGFNSAATFLRQFRRWTGFNPSELRRRRRWGWPPQRCSNTLGVAL